MKYNEEEFKNKVLSIYNNRYELVSRFKGLTQPILIQDKYGVLSISQAHLLLKYEPTIKCALNKTEYFMNLLKEVHPEIASELSPQSEYKAMKSKMLFNTLFGLVSVNPDALLHGHTPNIRSAVNRKDYFKNQLLFIYDNKYDFEITSTDRHKGRVTLICPIHGPQSVDSDAIFLGSGCPLCNKGWEKSDVFYLVKLFNTKESFYKLGISHYDLDGNVTRFRSYYQLGYQIEEIKIIKFDDFLIARQLETKLKRIIKNNLYKPQNWDHETSTECFSDSILPTILNNLEHDIVSTSMETLSSLNIDGKEITTLSEENEV